MRDILRDLRAFIIDSLGVFPFLAIAGTAVGLSLAPSIYLFTRFYHSMRDIADWYYYPLLGLAIVVCYFTYGAALILIAPLLNLVLGGRLKPIKAPAVSFKSIPWYVHAALTLIVRYTILEIITPTPYQQLYYRLMGMKIGRKVWINSAAIADPSLISLEDNVTIGGSASLMAHYAQGGNLVIEPVRICQGATIGMRAIIMGGVEVGARAKVLAGSFVLPNTKIPPGETWGGIPARKLDMKKLREGAE